MIICKASILYSQTSPSLCYYFPPSGRKQRPLTELHFNREICCKNGALSLRKMMKPFKYSQEDHLNDWDNNIIGDCVVFEDGIFEDPVANKYTSCKEDQEEEEDGSLIPDKWQDLQKELNISKKEKKMRMLRLESMNSFQRKREIELLRDGLSQYNTIKLPQLDFTHSDENKAELKGISVEENALSLVESSSNDSVDELGDLREETEIFSDEESGTYQVEKPFERVSDSLDMMGISTVGNREEVDSGVDGEMRLESYVSQSFLTTSVRDENSEKFLEGFAGGSVLPRNAGQMTDISSVHNRVFPRNPRCEVVGAGFKDISKKLEEEYGKSDDQSALEDRPQDRQQLYTPEEKALLNRRVPDLERATSGKWLPLHTFSTVGQSYLLDFLLTHDVDINVTDKDGRTALHKAISCKKQGIASYLLKAGADALVRDKDGATLVHYAVEVAAIQIIKLLILYKVDINLPDNYGWTPLHLAVQSRRTDVVRFLLVKGADKNIRNKDKYTPLDLCLHSGQNVRTYELIRLLKTMPKNTFQNSVSDQVGTKNIHFQVL